MHYTNAPQPEVTSELIVSCLAKIHGRNDTDFEFGVHWRPDTQVQCRHGYEVETDTIGTVERSAGYSFGGVCSGYFVFTENGGNISFPGPTGKGNIPTILGKDKVTTTYTTKTIPSGSFNGPDGIGINFIPMPTLNLGIGPPMNTKLKVCVVPTVNLGKATNDQLTGNFGLWGVGVMHAIKQWIPGMKMLPFDLSGFFGY